MGKPYSMDLRDRVVGAVEQEGLSRRQAAARFGVSYSAAIGWLKRFGRLAASRLGKWAATGRRRFRVSTMIGWCNAAGRGTSPCAVWSANWPSAG